MSYARGLVRCGNCDKSFDALSCLFDQWPSGQAHAPARGSHTGPPVIGQTQTRSAIAGVNAAENNGSEDTKTDPRSLTWGVVTALLVLLTIANTAWTFRDPLLQVPEISVWLENRGWLQVKKEGLLIAPEQIQLVSRDMHSHPTRSGILILSLTFVNLAQTSQVFPVLEVTLLDVSNQPVAQRRFQPLEYLRTGVDTGPGLATDVFLPVLLELGDAGERAVGFEIQFL